MSDPYIRNIALKYRLAVALAVLKGKPHNVSLENYIEELKRKINNENIDDLDLTVCSDDFDMEENARAKETNGDLIIANGHTNDDTNNSVTILQDYNLQLHNTSIETTQNTTQSMTKEMQTNFIVESQARSQESIHLTQIENASNTETFCPTQYEHNYHNVILNNVTETRFNLNEVHETNDVNATNHIVSNEVNIINNTDLTYYDSQATELYSLHGYTQNYTHVSQSQNYNEIVISDKLIKGRNNGEKSHTSHDIQEIALTINSLQNNPNPIECSQEPFDNNKDLTDETIEIDKNNLLTIENETNIIKTNENQLSTQINGSFPQYAQNLNDISEETIIKVSENSNKNENRSKENEGIDENDFPSNESQIVSFKVVEELNKVKNYMNKQVERRLSNDGSVDSGYRSDSQSKCSFRSSLQLSGNWLNQSAHSLYEYITQCPLLVTTQEIIEEIAQVLGKLIDRLHEEEKYPSFLDELLEHVNVLLQDISEESGGEDILLTKDEKVQRLLLLNKSVHIQKYTIEKITSTLENLLFHLTNPEETYEISNISQIENSSYIFHLLEVLLQRYIKRKNVSTQELTDSQIQLKKSSITELWRKKWNPNYKDEIIEEFTPKKCVLIKCNEVLNKLIVATMDGYSLIAFSALNCFNMLQS